MGERGVVAKHRYRSDLLKREEAQEICFHWLEGEDGKKDDLQSPHRRSWRSSERQR